MYISSQLFILMTFSLFNVGSGFIPFALWDDGIIYKDTTQLLTRG